MKYLVLRILLVATIVAVGADAKAQDPASGSSEYLIKAGFIYNFARLVEWPGQASQKDKPIVIGVLGSDAFAAILNNVVDGKKLDGRPFEVKRLKTREFTDCRCHILFVTAAESSRLDDIINLQRTASVLTISEAPDFARRGGIIAFVLADSKVRFEVNVEAAKQASLTVSSRLLTLATVVPTSR